MSDIYAAPGAKLDAFAEADPSTANKPKAVLLLQIWAMVIVALLAVAFMKNLHNIDGRAYYDFMGISGKTRSYIMAGIVVFVLVMLYGLDRRAMVGRVFALSLIFVTAAPFFAQFFAPFYRGSALEVVIRYGVIVLICLGFVYWGYALSFSERARGYFSQDPD